MASSEVEVASSAPFGCILRDHNSPRERFGANSGKNFNMALVRSGEEEEETSSSPASWAGPTNRWARVRERVAMERESLREEREITRTQSESAVEVPNMGGVSSLVRRWMDFAGSHLNSFSSSSSAGGVGGGASPRNVNPLTATDLQPRPVSEAATSDFGDDKFETGVVMTEDSLAEWEIEGVDNCTNGGNGSNSGEIERPSVAEVIKKLTKENQMQGSLVSWSNNNGPDVGERSLPRVQIVSERNTTTATTENRGAWQSPSLRIRGRQALADLVTQMERERQREINRLLDRRAVSKFSHKGRIQAMLRLRFMRRGLEKEGYSDYDRQSSSVVNRGKIPGTVSGERIPRPRKPDEDRRRQQGHSNTDSAEKRTEVLVTECRNSEEMQRRSLLKEKATCDSDRSSELECSTSSVVVLREKFNAGAESSCDTVNLKWIRRDVACCSTSSIGSCSNSDQLKDKTKPLPLPLPIPGDKNQITTSNNAEKALSPELPCPDTQTSINEQETSKEEVNDQEELTVSNHESSADEIPTHIGLEGEENADGDSMNHHQDYWSYDNDDDQYNGGVESDYDHMGDNNDWIMDISRPRSDWEDLRQERYQEMLDPFQLNQDIRELLQRGSVSSFLSSGLRQTIDNLMMSRIQPQLSPMRERREQLVISRPPREPFSLNNQQEEQVVVEERREQFVISHTQREPLPLKNQQEEQVVVEERMEEQFVISCPQREPLPLNYHQEEHVMVEDSGVEKIEEEEEEEGNLISWQSDEVEWDTNNHDHIVSSLLEESSHLQHERTSPSFSLDNLQSAQTNRSLLEMDFLNDLKGNIGQLHEEMSELRRFLKLCISMQAKLQHSIKHDIAAAVKHELSSVMTKSAQKEGSPLKGRKGNCCICYEMKIDSLLYRCGHMCTCFNCAHELQRNSGRCPICGSPIIDIVRPFIDDS